MSRWPRLSDAARILPRIAYRIAWYLGLGTPEWEYVADHWPRNDRRSSGWDDSSVVRNMGKNYTVYKRAVEGTGPLAFWPWFTNGRDIYAHNAIITWGYVLARAASGKPQLSVLDWGGALGNYAVVGKALLPEVQLNYTVKERPALCAAGRELSPEVSFTSSDDECFSRRYDIVVASGSLQYSEDWRSIVCRLAHAAEPWLLITHLPIARKSQSFVVVQRPQREGFEADMLSWVLNCDEFVEHVKSLGLVLEREFLSILGTRYRKEPESSEFLSFLFRQA